MGATPSEGLAEQPYAIRPLPEAGAAGLRLTGGSPRAILWAAYEVVAAWGIHFLVQGDVFPEDPGPFRVPAGAGSRAPAHPVIRSPRQARGDAHHHEPSMAYMVESAWDAAVTPEDAYRRYALGVAGPEAADDLLAALHGIEEITDAAKGLRGLGFMWSSLHRKHWQPGAQPGPAWQEPVARLAPIEQRLECALEHAVAQGRRLVRNYLSFVRFAGLFLRTLDLIRQARAAYDQAQEKWQARDPVAYHPLMVRSSDLLSAALEASERALRTWADQVADPTGLGTLAGLNAYGHDRLRGKCTEVYWESCCYGSSHLG